MDVFVTQDGPSEQMITYQDFLETFNAISQDYHACPADQKGVVVAVAIVDSDGELMAVLYKNSLTWDLKESSFNSKELDLMSKLAGNMPEFRGKIEG